MEKKFVKPTFHVPDEHIAALPAFEKNFPFSFLNLLDLFQKSLPPVWLTQ